MSETRERPPPILKTMMVGPLEGDDGDLRAPTTYLKDVDGGAWEGDVGDPRAPTIYHKDVDGEHPGRRWWRFGSAHHLS
jgi:hypothetical protein